MRSRGAWPSWLAHAPFRNGVFSGREDAAHVDSATGQPVIDRPNVTGTSFTATQPLTPGHNYTMYVGAISTDRLVNSYNSAGQAFALATLANPNQIGPASAIASTTPTFEWSAVAGADHYYLYVVDQATGQAVINQPLVMGTSQASPVTLTRGRRYTWYLGAISTNGLVNSYRIEGLVFEIV